MICDAILDYDKCIFVSTKGIYASIFRRQEYQSLENMIEGIYILFTIILSIFVLFLCIDACNHNNTFQQGFDPTTLQPIDKHNLRKYF